MDISSETAFSPHVTQVAAHFGALLKVVRYRQDCKQIDVLVHLQGWTQTMYSRLESGEAAPAFKDLPALYTALLRAGILWTPLERSQFVTLARKRIEAKRSRQDHHSEHEWDTLHLSLAHIGQPHEPGVASTEQASLTILRESRHLVGRQNWLRSVVALFSQVLPKKLVVLQGPAGVGKSSELHRLALRVLEREAPRRRVVLCDLPATEHDLDPEGALDLLLATILAEVGAPGSVLPMASLNVRMRLALHTLEQSPRPVLLLLDNAEHLLTQRGRLAACWEQFLTQFLSSPHAATLLLATREWRGWAGRDGQLVAEMTVPLLNGEESVQVLRRLGLEGVPVEQVQALGDRVAGIPLCLEWLARLVRDPLELDAWWDLADEEQNRSDQQSVESITRRIGHLLEEPDLVQGHLASHAGPLLQRLLDTHLSKGARQVLEQITVATIPLGGPALQRLCPRPALLKELRDASLLAAAANRVQVLPMVAAMLTAQRSSEHTRVLEEHLIEALTSWLEEGMMGTSEAGAIIAELAMVYLRHHRLLDAAELLIRYGWLSFNQGYGPRLARLAARVVEEFDWHGTESDECGGLLLCDYLGPFYGKTFDAKKRFANYWSVYEAIMAGRVHCQPATEIHVAHYLMLLSLNDLHFEQAQSFLETFSRRLELYLISDHDLQASLLEESTMLFSRWRDYSDEQREMQRAKIFQAKTINLYRESIRILSRYEGLSSLKSHLFKKRLGRSFNSLGYQLYLAGSYEEALKFVECSIALKEQGYVQFGGLAAAYGDKSQILAKLGRFQEALFFDKKAIAEVQLLADSGHALSREEVWIYRINRGCLYLRIGKIAEAEEVLLEALRHIHPRRRVYQMFAKEALEEIEQWRRSATSPEHQLDWRWIKRYRELSAYDAYWWWAQAGPFTEEEQHQWKQLFSLNPDEAIKNQLGTLLARSRDREVEAAFTHHREPRLCYPTLDIEEVRRRIAGFLQLDAEIQHHEPNAIVRRLYHGTIEDELSFIRAIEATYEGKSERFWDLNRYLNPPPTHEEMAYALSHVRQIVRLGFQRADTVDVGKRVVQVLREQLHLDFSDEAEQVPLPGKNEVLSSVDNQRMVSAHAAKHFFETTLQEAGFHGWRVVLDSDSGGTRIDSALRVLFLPNHPLTLETVREYFVHELVGHVSRSVAGEHSPLGLLGINTKGYAPTEEGLAFYYERTVADLRGEVFDDSGSWLGGLAVGLASGMMTPPQTFSSLFMFFEPFLLLYRLLWRDDEDRSTAEKRAHQRALTRCLRTFRGVPDLKHAGICYTRDVVYLRGRLKIEQAVKQDETILDRLAVGKVALELLPDLQELGIVAPGQSLRKRAYDPDLDAYILSFDSAQES